MRASVLRIPDAAPWRTKLMQFKANARADLGSPPPGLLLIVPTQGRSQA